MQVLTIPSNLLGVPNKMIQINVEKQIRVKITFIKLPKSRINIITPLQTHKLYTKIKFISFGINFMCIRR